MPSALARFVALVVALRGSKRDFSSAERTLARIEKLRRKPRPHDPPRSLARRVKVDLRTVDGWPVYDLSPRVAPTDRRALYLHGGCYVFEINALHWAIASKLAAETGAVVTVPVVPLAPLETASTVIPRVADLAAALIDEVGAQNVTIVGDSAGGGMALAVAMELRDRGLPPLGGTVLISPWLDIGLTDPRLAELDALDPILSVPGLRAAGELYRGELSESDWRVSPITGALAGLGPLVLFSGTRDILTADAERLVSLAAAAGLPVDHHQGAGMLHVYPILPIPEGETARDVIVASMIR